MLLYINRIMSDNRKLTVLGLSAGNGVLLYPFLKDPLFEVKWNVEARSKYLIGGMPLQWHLNFGDIPFSTNLSIALEDVDIAIGHPSCGYSSVFALSRRKEFRSHRDEPSLTLFIQGIHQHFPKYFLLENLPKLLDSYSKEDFEGIFSNYKLLFWTGSVSQFGNSQVSRKRLIIIGIRKDIYTTKAKLFLKRRRVYKSLLTADELIANLPSNGHIREPLEETIAVYGGKKATLAELQEYWLNNPNLDRYKVGSSKMSYAPGVYINRKGSYPKTVRPINRQFNHEGLQLTPREMARIQGIPDDFKFCDPETCDKPLKLLINKGRITAAKTPPYEIGLWFKNTLKQLKF